MIIKHSQGHIDSIFTDGEWKTLKKKKKVEEKKKKVEDNIEEKKEK